MSIRKIQIEIYESDPFTCSCTAPKRVSDKEADAFRDDLIKRSRIVKEILRDRSNVAMVRRDVVTTRRAEYPPYVRKAIAEGRPLPFLFADDELLSCGRFPEREELLKVIDDRIAARR